MKALQLIILLSIPLTLKGSGSFEITSYHKEAYELIIAMRFEEGQEVIELIKQQQPQNVLVYHIENYIDFISIFINEEEAEFKQKEQNKDLRLAKLRQGDRDSPYYLFSQAEIHLQWALTRVKFQEYFTAALEVNKAIGMLERNMKLFPEFISNKKSLSILHAVAGSIPDNYRGVISLVSNVSGTIDQGISEINDVLQKTDQTYLFRKEAIAIKAMVMLHLKNEKQAAWKYLSTSELAQSDNPMSTFLLASTAIKCGKNEKAIEILKSRTRSPRFYPFYYLDLMLGSAKLNRLDKDADVYIKSYINNFEGQDYFKEAYRKLAWHGLAVLEDPSLYQYYMSMCEKEGKTRVDEDRSAMKEAKRRELPHAALLKARLYFDGGYFREAMDVLSTIEKQKLTASENLEYAYRSGRVFQKLGKTEYAISNFANCMNHPLKEEAHYSCSAALQLGIIYEQLGKKAQAETYFKRCLQMNPPEYKNSLHQKAKSGLNRIK